MKNFGNIVLLAVVLIVFSISFSGCKDFGSPDYTLTVVVEDGCTGTPEAGTYTFGELEEIEYEYFPPEDGIVIEVLANESGRADSGSLVMYNDLTLTVQILDIRGDWEFSYDQENEPAQEMTLTFSGTTPFSGTFSDSRGYNGTWTVEVDTLTITYLNWADYIFRGSISSMSGNYVGEGVSLGWTASRTD